MSLNENAREALDLKNLSLPSVLQVEEVTAEDYTDTSGESALRVTVILAEEVDVENLPESAVGILKSAIREGLRNHGVTEFPYIFLAKRSELAEVDDED